MGAAAVRWVRARRRGHVNAPQGLADGVAPGAILLVALGEDGECEAVDGYVLRRGEEVEAEEERRERLDLHALLGVQQRVAPPRLCWRWLVDRLLVVPKLFQALPDVVQRPVGHHLLRRAGKVLPPWGHFGKRAMKVEALKTNEFLHEN